LAIVDYWKKQNKIWYEDDCTNFTHMYKNEQYDIHVASKNNLAYYEELVKNIHSSYLNNNLSLSKSLSPEWKEHYAKRYYLNNSYLAVLDFWDKKSKMFD